MSPMYEKFFSSDLHKALQLNFHHLVKQYASDYTKYCQTHYRYHLQNDFLTLARREKIRAQAEEKFLQWIPLTLIGGEFVDASSYAAFKDPDHVLSKKQCLNTKGVAFLEAQLDIVETEMHLAIYAFEEARIMAHPEYKKITETLEQLVVEKTTLKQRNLDIRNKTKPAATHAEMREVWDNAE